MHGHMNVKPTLLKNFAKYVGLAKSHHQAT